MTSPPPPIAATRAARLERARVRAIAHAALLGVRHEPLVVGRFEVRRKLAHGASSVVYLAFDPSLGREVVLKLRLDVTLGPAEAAAEAATLARLAHPNVVAVFDVGVFEGLPYLVLEWMRGGSLRAQLARPRSAEASLAIVRGVGGGLAAAHRLGFVHRDLKPENVLLDGARVCIADFGFARAFDDASRGAPVGLGTPAYMAPEQATQRVPDPRVDQYAFAVLAHEVLFGEHPLLDARGRARAAAHTPAADHPLARLAPVLARGYARTAADRFPSVDALVEALDAALATPATRRRRAAGLAVAVALAASALAAVSVFRGAGPRGAGDDAIALADYERAVFAEVAPDLNAQRFGACAERLRGRLRTATLAAMAVRCADAARDPDLLDAVCAEAGTTMPTDPVPECDPVRRAAYRALSEGALDRCMDLVLAAPPTVARAQPLNACAASLAHRRDLDVCIYGLRLEGRPDPQATCRGLQIVDPAH